MSKLRGLLIAVFAAAALLAMGAFGWGVLAGRQETRVQSSVIGALPTADSANFERVMGPRELVFPRDHGPHPTFQTEWWYYTGSLQGEDGRRFGYQLTFFRRGAGPGDWREARASAWAANHVYMAHFTVTDVQAGSFFAYERFERGAAGLAGAQGEPAFQVWLRDWSVEQTGAGEYHLRAGEGDVAVDLRLVDGKGITLQGDRGYSRKGPEPGNASLYYSQTRLETEGTLTIGQKAYAVSGSSWMDREISTSALSEGQVGWDWFALQLDDGSELMVYIIRDRKGEASVYSSGMFVDADGTATALAYDNFEIRPEGVWRSPHSGGEYPARWHVSVPALALDLTVTPLVADQELNLSVTYWEGAVQVAGERAGKPLSGYGYVELTGYADSLEGDV